MALVDTSLPGSPGARRHAVRRHRHYFLGSPFDGISQEAALHLIDASAPGRRLRYVVTPNVDHVVRLNAQIGLAIYYDQAWLSLCDSRPIAMLARAVSLDLPLAPGSDLTARLFASVIKDGDLVTLIAANDEIVQDMKTRYPAIRFRALVPPAGVLADPKALQDCIDFVVGEEARFVFIGIGSPQSEKIAHALSRHPDARGVALCTGAALEFLVGRKKRAPVWMRRFGLEWLHRLACDPKRLWRRYLYSFVPLLHLFAIELVNRQRRTVRSRHSA